jgi:hypothetical protein
MRLRATGKLGELCSEASVPVLPAKEKVIGFRLLQYTVYRRGVLKKVALPTTTGWVYLTSDRILMLDEGWTAKDGAQWKTFQEVLFQEVDWVRLRRLVVWVDVAARDGKYVISFLPYGPAARLFNWLLREKTTRRKYEAGELESAYVKERWYRHPPK